ncbi:dephospho-CoA kinase [Sulfurovum sp.]|uniref:dephospho-CoA kinase n=1 Tax=Sulfurovum sp. TaxID=1969726 RepID=UPI0025ECBE48|nr:dephospho-CoA kinase [Sulfurovum sp.]
MNEAVQAINGAGNKQLINGDEVQDQQQPFKYAVALTGGIATGKSTVAAQFVSAGFVVIDADRIAHQILDDVSFEVARLFGDEVLQNGKVNRAILGRIIFAQTQKRKVLEALLHPLIFDEILRLSDIEDQKKKPYLVDIPLFFETGRYNIGRVIVVYASQQQQIERAMQRDSVSKEAVLRRIEAQMDMEQKRNQADYLIDNSGDEQQLNKEVISVIQHIKKDFS